jgi:hypothetical protein
MTVSELPPPPAHGTVQEQLDAQRRELALLRNQVNFLVASLEDAVRRHEARRAAARPRWRGRHLSVARPS